MKKLIVSLVLIMFLAPLALATLASDYYSTNVGSAYGKFVKTKTPVTDKIHLNAYSTKAATAELSAGECFIQLLDNTGGDIKLYIGAKDKAGAYYYRTIELGKLATNDAITVQ